VLVAQEDLPLTPRLPQLVVILLLLFQEQLQRWVAAEAIIARLEILEVLVLVEVALVMALLGVLVLLGKDTLVVQVMHRQVILLVVVEVELRLVLMP